MLLPILSFACSQAEIQLKALSPEIVSDQRWQDLGDLEAKDEVKVSMTEKYIYAQTGKSIFRKALQSKEPWTLLKTFDDELISVFAISGEPDTIIGSVAEAFETLPLRISHDGGATWKEFGTEFTANPDGVGSEYESPIHFLVVPPKKIIASLTGSNTAISNDFGKTWTYAYGKASMQTCASGIAAVLPAYPNFVFKGQECPSDNAWIGWFNPMGSEPKNLEKLVDSKIMSNQRPTSFASVASQPDLLFVGTEGGFLKFDAKSKKANWLLQAGSGGRTVGRLEPKDTQWNGDITNIWIDPSNPQHMAISGVSRGGSIEFLFFETSDGGARFQSLRSPTDPSALTKSYGGFSLGKKLVLPARESENKVRFWLIDLTQKPPIGH